ncbi:MAG: helix-turn-helix domain-containing protein [Clostridiales bacterium]|nr:helix-turn-helix domain-containing protein [Clostridiales bacterium]
MENLGQKITELRKKRNLTQSELGEKLNVTSQAVSKWENNLSEPDLETTKRLCEILGVSMNELLDFESKQTQAETPTPVIIERIVEKPVETPPTKIILGYCKECNRAVSNGEYVVANDGVGVICNKCKKEKEIQRAKADKEFTASDFKKGLIWGGIILTLGLLLGLIIGLSGASSGIFDAGTTITLIMVFTVFGYMVSALVSECCWDGSALDVLAFFLRSFQMPGIIFTLDWDGIKFLIAAKIAFAILSAVLSAVIFIIGLIISSIYASIIFPFSLTSTIKNLKQSYKDVENAENA